MSKRPTDADEPAAKKRGSARQLTKDDASDDEVEEKGSIETATEEVMKARRVVKARRPGGGGAPAPTPAPGAGAPPPAANPFSGVSLLGGTGASGGSSGFAALAAAKTEEPAKPAEAAASTPAAGDAEASKADAKADESAAAAAEAKPAGEKGGDAAAAPAFASFASTAAPFAATAGSRPVFNFGTAAAAGDSNGSAQPGAFSFSGAAAGAPGAFSFKPPEGGFPSVQSIFGAGATVDQESGGGEEGGRGLKPALAALPPEAEQKTGEEGEETVWAGEGTLYEFAAGRQWRERGRGELRINRGGERPGARFVMRQKGYLRLLMNARLWPDMKVSRMDGGKGATFPVVNAVPGPEDKAEEEPRLKTFAFRLKSAGQLEAFIAAVDAHKAASGDAPAEAPASDAAKAEEAKS